MPHMERIGSAQMPATVMAMAMTYDWLFHWDYDVDNKSYMWTINPTNGIMDTYNW